MARPTFGTYAPPYRGSGGRRLADLESWLHSKFSKHAPGRVIFEAPFSGPNAKAFAMACKMAGVIELTCERRGVQCVEATAHQWRKHFLGFAMAPRKLNSKQERRAWLKRRAIVACRARNWAVENDDEADALGLLDYSLALSDAEYKRRSRGLSDGLDTG